MNRCLRTQQVFYQRSRARTRIALLRKWCIFVRVGCRQVDVCPRNSAGERFHKERRRDGARALTAGDVLQVGNVASYLILVVGVQRKLPQLLSARSSGFDQTIYQALFRAQYSRYLLAKRDNARPRQRGNIDYLINACLARVRNRVGEG